MKTDKPARTRKGKDFDIAAEKAMRKQVAKAEQQQAEKDLSIFKGPLY